MQCGINLILRHLAFCNGHKAAFVQTLDMLSRNRQRYTHNLAIPHGFSRFKRALNRIYNGIKIGDTAAVDTL